MYDSAGDVALFHRSDPDTHADGEVPISQLAQGDLVMTADNGAHLVRWIWCTLGPAAVLSRRPGFRPVRILRGAFGANRPIRDTS